MTGHGSKFTRKMEDAVSALLTQRSIEEAARVAGVGTQTLLRWLKVPECQTAYREARRATYSQSVARLQQGSSAAASILMKVMLDQNSPASTRVRAAECILNHAHRAIEVEDVEVRVSELERSSELSKGGR